MSVFYDILTAVKSQIDTLSLTINGNSLATVIRKLPKKEAGVDAPNQITVSPSQTEPRITPWAFGNRFLHEYLIEITLICPNNDDQFTDLDNYSQIRQDISNLFLLPNSIAVSGVLDTRLMDADFHDRKFVISGYDFMQLILKVRTVETKY